MLITANYDTSKQQKIKIDLSSNPLTVVNQLSFLPVLEYFVTNKLESNATTIDIANTGNHNMNKFS